MPLAPYSSHSLPPDPVKLSTALPIRIFRTTCLIRISVRRFSVSRRPPTPRATFPPRRRASLLLAPNWERPSALSRHSWVYDRIARLLRVTEESALLRMTRVRLKWVRFATTIPMKTFHRWPCPGALCVSSSPRSIVTLTRTAARRCARVNCSSC